MNCTRHSERDAVAACAECGDLVCTDCRRVGDDGLAACPECAGEPLSEPESKPSVAADPLVTIEPGASVATLEDSPETQPAATEATDPVEVSGVAPIPWEHPEAYRDSEAFRATVAQAIFRPMQFMTRVPWIRADLRTPLVFAVLCGAVGYVGMTITGSLVEMPGQATPPLLPGLGALPPTVTRLLVMPLLPLTIAASLFVQAGLAHALLSLVGATRRPFEATFRVFAYASAASVFLVLPVIGPHVDIMFTVLLVLSGMRAAHDTTFATGLLALAPLLLAQLVMPMH